MRISDWSSDVCSSDLLHLQRDHRHRRLLLRHRVGLRRRLRLLHRDDGHQARGPAGEEVVNRAALTVAAGAGMLLVPLLGVPDYYMHMLILILIWSLAYTAWSIMGRFRSEEHTSELQ